MRGCIKMRFNAPDQFSGRRQSQKIDSFTSEVFYFVLQNTLFLENE